MKQITIATQIMIAKTDLGTILSVMPKGLVNCRVPTGGLKHRLGVVRRIKSLMVVAVGSQSQRKMVSKNAVCLVNRGVVPREHLFIIKPVFLATVPTIFILPAMIPTDALFVQIVSGMANGVAPLNAQTRMPN